MAKDLLLVVDDDEGIREQLKWALTEDYEVFLASNPSEAMEKVTEKRPDLVLLDIGLSPHSGDEEGMELLKKMVKSDPKLKVIMITGKEGRELALKAVQLGAHDYFQKPVDIDELKVIIKRALYVQKLERENEALFHRLEEEKRFEDLIGCCPQMLNVYEVIKRVSATDATALIYGESGTGKELVARAIHYRSPRKGKPFVTINCGAIPENLLESELFGHEKGSFTGAHIQRKGKFEIANGGTVFLDEIGELSTNLQVKLLRVLQERQIERVGGNVPIQLDVRVIAASNKDLDVEMEKDNFRQDLYYRLGVISLSLPPLRERGDDIILLAKSFLCHFSRDYGKRIRGFSPEAIRAMMEYRWPGNVRELENKVKRAIIMADGNVIQSQDLDLKSRPRMGDLSLREAKETVEEEFIREALAVNKWNISKAAAELNISRPSLYDLMAKYGIEKKKSKSYSGVNN
jgi:two-component system NtrC family response regulator